MLLAGVRRTDFSVCTMLQWKRKSQWFNQDSKGLAPMTAFHPQKFISAKQGLGYVQSRTCVTSVCCKCHFHDIAGRCRFQLAGELLVGLGWYEPPGLICWHVGRQQTKKRILNNMINRWSSFASYRVSDVNMQVFAQTAQMV